MAGQHESTGPLASCRAAGHIIKASATADPHLWAFECRTCSRAATGAARYCRHCGVPLSPPARAGLEKDFCSDRHRAAWREDMIAATLDRAVSIVEETRDLIDVQVSALQQQDAKLDGVLQQLRNIRRGPRRKKPAQPVQS